MCFAAFNAHAVDSQDILKASFAEGEVATQVFSFKLRGAYNKMTGLTAEQRDKGVICSSAGNHAQGVALAAHKLVRQSHNCIEHWMQ